MKSLSNEDKKALHLLALRTVKKLDFDIFKKVWYRNERALHFSLAEFEQCTYDWYVYDYGNKVCLICNSSLLDPRDISEHGLFHLREKNLLSFI